MSNCSHDCSSCGSDCSQRSLRIPANSRSKIKKVVAIASGKGGVGKSTITAGLAVALNRRGYKVGILDADITGPSIPTAFGLHGQTYATDEGILPAVTKEGIRVISLNLLTADETDPVVWRGPVIAGVVQQFWADVQWGELDYLLVDLPPGTGDVPLTVFQALPVDGVFVVTTPQDLVSMIVAKAVHMAQMMEVPILGLIENYSFFPCPGCGENHAIFGQSKLPQVAEKLELEVLAHLPINPALASAVDRGEIAQIDTTPLDGAVQVVEKLLCQ